MDKQLAKNKIIFLVAPPRSLSTAFLRMMAAREEFTIMNEPSNSVYNLHHFPHSKSFYSEQALTQYSEVKKKILAAAEKSPVFVKEMSFAFDELIQAEPDLMQDPNIYFIYLLRNPHPCIISYYNKMPAETLDYIISDFGQLTGFPALHASFKRIQEQAFRQPYVVHAEQLYSDTQTTVQAFCDYTQLTFNKEHLHWDNLGTGFNGFKEWQENKKEGFTYHWHHEAIQSQGFHQPRQYDLDDNNQPTFAEISHTGHRTQCLKVYQESKALYDAINIP